VRPSIFALFLIAAAVLGEIPVASAQSPTSYPWCARTGKDASATSRYFTSCQQCMTTISGIGAYCYQSPYCHAAPANGPVHPRRR